MAKVFSEGSGKAADTSDHHQTTLHASDSGTVHLPEGIDAGSLEMARDGQNLVLTAPNGDTIIVENYFSGLEAPALISSTGALLSPALIESFLKTAGDVQLAANNQSTSDGSPVGEVSEVTGHATVTHADGSKETISNGTKIFEHDIVETDAKGAVNIKFADESTFAVSQNARMAIDDFSFNSHDQSGTTGISILRGVFMFTSGLIGRENPDAVHLETPVGSIGIRGTIIGGQIHENGKAQISVLEGAIVVHNGTGEQILSSQFETVQLTGFNAPISNVGQLNAASMTTSYGAVSSVSQQLFTSIQDTAREAQPQQQQQQQQQQDKAAPATQGDTPQSDSGHGADATPQAAAQQPAAQTATQAPAQTSAPAAETTVFQTLSTGSGIDGSVSASQPAAPAPAPVAAPAPVVVVSVPVPAPVVAPVVTTTPVQAIQPVPNVVFSTGGHVAEESTELRVGKLDLSSKYAGSVTYSLVDSHDGLFAVSANGFVTLVGTSGDYDTGTTSYDIVVRATRTDGGLFTDTKLSIAVTNVDEAPVFTAAQNLALNMQENATVTLSPTAFGAHDPENGNITYTVSQNNHMIVRVNGQDTTTFTQADLNAGHVTMTQDGSESNNAGFILTASDDAGNHSVRSFTANIANVDDPLTLSHNNGDNGGQMAEGSGRSIGSNVLQYLDNDNSPAEIVYTLTSVEHGVVSKDSIALAAGAHFTQADINNGLIRFNHDGSESSSGVPTNGNVNYSVSSGGGSALTGTLTFHPAEVNDAPIDHHTTTGLVNVNGSLVLTAAMLSYTDEESPAGQLYYQVKNTANGTVQITSDGATWAALGAGAMFTQADINAGHVRVVQGSGNTGADHVTINYDLIDGGRAINHDLSVNINLPAQITALTAEGSLNESDSLSGNTKVPIISLNDTVLAPGLPYVFSVLTDANDPGVFVADSRFRVSLENGAYHVVAKDGRYFDHEDEPVINIKVTVADNGGVPVTSPVFTLHVGDVNEAPTMFELNFGEQYKTGSVDGLISGRAANAIVGVLNTDDPDSGTFQTHATDFQVTAVTNESGNGRTLSASDFEVIDRTDMNGNVEQVLRLKYAASNIFGASGDHYTVTVALNTTGGVITEFFSLTGRNDTMMLHNINGTNGFRIVNDSNEGAHFGASFAMADISGDGIPDLLIGSPDSDDHATQIGGLYAMRNTLDNVAYAAKTQVNLLGVLGTDANNVNFYPGSAAGFGSQLVALQRFDAAGHTAFATTLPGSHSVEIDVNGGSGLTTTTVTGIPTATGDAMLASITIASIGDVNGDGYSDLLVGASAAGDGAGTAGIVYGGASSSNTITWDSLQKLTGPTGSHFGGEVMGIGDINGDGLSDFAVSAPNYNNPASAGTDEGLVKIYYGSATQASLLAADMTITTVAAGNHLGQTLGSAGDFNGDGYDDVMISRDFTDNGRGAITLMFGSNHLASTVSSQDSLNDTSNFRGATIHYDENDTAMHITNFAGIGDFNGDGYSDVAVDLSKTNGDGTYDHTVYLIYGNNSGNTEYDLSALTNSASGAYKLIDNGTTAEKLSFQGLGDINGDGFDDVVIGDIGANNENGDATVFYGASYAGVTSISGTTTVTATSNGTSYVGKSDDNTLDNGSATNLSFHGGQGNDTFVMHSTAALREFAGGLGTDTIKLFFSAGETTGEADTINLAGIGTKTSGVERIDFDGSSKNDTLALTIADVIGMAQSSNDIVGGFHRLTIGLGATAAGSDANHLVITDGTGNSISDLSALSGNNHFTSSGITTVDSHSYAVYTNTASNVQLLVETHIAAATSLATAAAV